MTDKHNREDSDGFLESGPEFSLLDFLIVLAKHKVAFVLLPAVVTLAAVAISFLFPNIYIGVARVLPPQQGLSPALSALASIGGAANLPIGALGIKNPSDLYVGLLRSRTIADQLIAQFDLQSIYRLDTLVETRKELESATSITASKDGIIAIEVDDVDPNRAAQIANAYVNALDRLLQGLALTDAAQRSVFYERQLKQAKESLVSAELALQETQQTTGLIKIEEQGKAIVEFIAALRAQIAAKEVQIASLATYSTPQQPDFKRAHEELQKLKSQLSSLERQHGVEKGNMLLSVRQLPEAAVEYVRKYRDLKYQESLYEVLAKQYEQARLDEANNALVVQTVDVAIPPDRKSRPRRALIGIVALAASVFLTAIALFLYEAVGRSRNPNVASSVASLIGYLRSWR